MKNCFENNGTIFIVKRLPGETNNYFFEKGNFIQKNNPKNKDEYNKTLIKAHIHCNQKILHCSYNSSS